MRKYLAVFSVIVLMLTLVLGGCGKKDQALQGTEARQTQQTEATQNQTQNTEPADKFVAPEGYVSVVQVTINPTVNLYLDGEEKILAVEHPENACLPRLLTRGGSMMVFSLLQFTNPSSGMLVRAS